MQVQQQVPLAAYTTIGIGGPARYYCEAVTEADVEQAVVEAARLGVSLFVLGGGSNLLVPDEGYAGLVLHMRIAGITEPERGILHVSAGEDWDSFVRLATGKNYAGIECLAGIPGSVGGTPVQNVGAYGQEVAETMLSVRAYDRSANAFVDLSNAECQFRYRQSLFNTAARNRYIVTRVTFRLRPDGEPTLSYADLRRHFAGRDNPTLDEVASTVREIRRGKGMLLIPGDPNCRSVGSFFRNPIVPDSKAVAIANSDGAAEMPQWPAGEGLTKLSAAWLIERAGFTKGFALGHAGISSLHTLALINRGGATYTEIDALRQAIVEAVKKRFGVVLEREPVVLD